MDKMVTITEPGRQLTWVTITLFYLLGTDPDARKDGRQEEKGATKDEMVVWHHRLDGQEFKQAPGDRGRERKEPGVIQSMRTQRIRHDLVTEQQKQTYFLKLHIFRIKSVLEPMLCVSYIYSMYVS